MDNRDWELLEEADWLFRKLVRRFVKERDKITIEGISLPGMLILNSISQQGDQRLGELAEQLDFTSGAVTALCDKLEDGGFAVRVRSEEDRRTVVLRITGQGRELLKRNRDAGAYMISILFEGFTSEELAAQVGSFKRLSRNVERFSDTVMAYAAEKQAGSEKAKSQEPSSRTNRFISY
ncbi:MarR family transcriptional regulator [Paenibacillus pinisoli]|uniref:MarR family transcriptional regulator n=1 Tax=Paenibacillus pinisoli TaxID=1276110 RepID=A0A3A6PSQ0_9BACL|nr:MarR family transcriptional regulator [Paenibacillus pinisoli]RJX38853.1 MarR family transcriptional regulator [Paenibacillus pinisoli]